MKQTQSIQVRLSDGGRLNVRFTPEEKEMIRNKAEAENMTMSALLRRSLEEFDKPISVNLDDSELRDLIIQVRRINVNVRTLLKNINFNEPFTFREKKEIEQQLLRNEEAVLEKQKYVRDIVLKQENLSTVEAIKLAAEIKDKKLRNIDEISESL